MSIGHAFFFSQGKFNPRKDKNTSVVIDDLPYDVTHNELLGSIRGCGKVKSVHIEYPVNAEDPATADIAFFRHIAAKRLVAQGQSGQVIVNGLRPTISWSTMRTPEEDDTNKSRVLRVSGPPNMISETKLMMFLMANLMFDIDDVFTVWSSEDSACFEVRFGAWRTQARTAKIALEQEYGDRFQMWYAADPCADGAQDNWMASAGGQRGLERRIINQ